MGVTKTRVATCSLVWLNYFVVVISIALVVLALVMKFANVEITVNTLPELFFIAVVGLFSLVFVVAFLGICSVTSKNKAASYIYLFLSLLITLTLFPILLYAIVYGNSSEHGGSVIGQVESMMEEQLANYAEENPGDWKAIQETLGCCGISAAAVMAVESPSIATALKTQLSGEEPINCTAQFGSLLSVYSLIDAQAITDDQQIETIVFQNVTGISENFFCADKIRSSIKEYTVHFAAVVSVLLLMQLFLLFSSIYLTCCSTHFQKEDEDGRTTIATNDSVLPPFKKSKRPNSDRGLSFLGWRPMSFVKKRNRMPNDSSVLQLGSIDQSFVDDDEDADDTSTGMANQPLDDLFSGGATDANVFGTGAPPPNMQKRRRRGNRDTPASGPTDDSPTSATSNPFFGSPTQDVDGNDLETSSDIESPTSNAYDDLFSGGNTDSGPFGTGAPPPGMVRRKRRQNRSPPTSPPEI